MEEMFEIDEKYSRIIIRKEVLTREIKIVEQEMEKEIKIEM